MTVSAEAGGCGGVSIDRSVLAALLCTTPDRKLSRLRMPESNLRTLSVRKRNAMRMAFCWWADSGQTLELIGIVLRRRDKRVKFI